MVDGGSAFCTFLELILVIFNEFISEVAELNVVIFHNLTSVRWTEPTINVLQNTK